MVFECANRTFGFVGAVDIGRGELNGDVGGVEVGDERGWNFIIEDMERWLKSLSGEERVDRRNHGGPIEGGPGAHG